MTERQQVLWGIFLAILTSLIILGGVLLSTAENRFRTDALRTETSVVLEEEMPTLVFILPVISSQTLEPTILATTTPTPTLTPLPGCPIPAGWITIVLENNESSDAIALRYGISVQELAAANCWDYPLNGLLAGTSLYVPSGDMKITPTAGIWCRPQGEQACVPVFYSTPTPTQTPTKVCQKRTGWTPYVVRNGDTLYTLSRTLGVSVQTLQQANCMGNSTAIRVGQTLYVPYLPPPPPPLPASATPRLTSFPMITPSPTLRIRPMTSTPAQPPVILPTVGATLPLHPPSPTPVVSQPVIPGPPPVTPVPTAALPIHPPVATPAPQPLSPYPAVYFPAVKGLGSLWVLRV